MQVFLNGKFLPIEEAKISPLDRGFLFGDGVYEVIPVYAGRLFRIDQHLQRLQNSLNAIRLNNPYSTREWLKILQELISQQGHENQSIYLQITRGADSKRDHAIPKNIEPTVFIMANQLISQPTDIAQSGVCTITRKDNRWHHCDVKAITLLANILLRQEAVDDSCAETLLIRDDKLIEGAASNVFMVKNGTIITPPKSPMLLPGVTRDFILEIAEEQSVPHEEREILANEIEQADEIWLTSSTKEILPVVKVDDITIGNGTPGALWQKMIQHYADYKQKLIAGDVV